MLLLITASHSTSTTHHGGWHGLIFQRHSLARLVLDMDEFGLSRDKMMLAGSLWAKASHGWWFGIEKTPIIRSAFCIDVVSCGH